MPEERDAHPLTDNHADARPKRPAMTQTCLIFAILTIGLAACSPAEPAGGPLVRDSAGITIVENQKPRWGTGEGWELSTEPTLDLGVMDGDPPYQFYQIAGTVRFPDGRIGVADSGSREVRFFGPDGSFQGATIGKGSGPGEFEDIFFLRRTRGDSLLAYDWRNRRVSVMDSHGRFARSFEFTVLTTTGGFPVVAEPFRNGDLLLGTDMFSTSTEPVFGAKRDSALYYVIRPDGQTRHELGSFPGGESYETNDGGNWVGGGLVFGRFGQAAVSGDGFFYGKSDSYEIEFRNGEGDLLRLIRLEHENLPVTQEDIDRYVADRMARARPERLQIYRTMFENMPFPDEMPAYSEFRVDASGHLWVAEYRKPGDDQPRWRVFDPEGAYLGMVETPADFRIYEIGTDYLLGRWTDDMEVEHVRMYALHKE